MDSRLPRFRVPLYSLIFMAIFAIALHSDEKKVEITTPGRTLSVTTGSMPPREETSGLLVLKIRGEVDDKLSQALKQRGIKLLDYIEKNTYWARCQGAVDLSGIVSIEAAHKAEACDKITAVLSEHLKKVGDRKETVVVTASFFEGTDYRRIVSLLRGIGARPLSSSMLYGNRMLVEIDPATIAQFAEDESVAVLEPGPGKKVGYNSNTAKSLGVDQVWKNYKVDGEGVNVGIWDGGSVFPHKAFRNRLVVVQKVDPEDHATHVAGTIAASHKKKQSKGMAYGASLYSYDYKGDVPTEMASAVREYDVLLTNNSWGYATGWELIDWGPGYGYYWTWFGKADFGRYSSEAAAYDKLIYQKDVTIVFAAGNDRGDDFTDWAYVDYDSLIIYEGLVIGKDGPYKTIGSNASAKNVITVGATRGKSWMTEFSSWGPTRDGRLKPEVTAPGVNVYSTLTKGKYGRSSGTSMSTPAVTGSLALLCEQWKEHAGEYPSNAVLRNIIAITATDRNPRGPDYKYGFGVLNVEKAAELIEANKENAIVIESAVTRKEQTHQYTLSLFGKPASRNVCLAWTDPPGRADATWALVNDLDIRVIDPNGKVYYPWTLDGDRPSKSAVQDVNDVDNIELVWLKKAKEGEWTVEVTATYFGKGTRQKYALSVWMADK